MIIEKEHRLAQTNHRNYSTFLGTFSFEMWDQNVLSNNTIRQYEKKTMELSVNA